MQLSPKAKTWIIATAGIVGIALTAMTMYVGANMESGKWSQVPWSQDAGARSCLFLLTELAFSAVLLLIGTSLLTKLTGDTFGNRFAALVAWLGVYYFSIGVAAALGTFVWWLVGIVAFLLLAGMLVRWAFDASGLGCVLAIGLFALVRVVALVGDILVVRAVMPNS